MNISYPKPKEEGRRFDAELPGEKSNKRRSEDMDDKTSGKGLSMLCNPQVSLNFCDLVCIYVWVKEIYFKKMLTVIAG